VFSYTSTPQYVLMAWCSVNEKHRDNFNFTYSVGTEGSYLVGKAAGGVKLTAHLRVVPRLGMRGAIPPLPHTSLRSGG
jgi:hypothetical protein